MGRTADATENGRRTLPEGGFMEHRRLIVAFVAVVALALSLGAHAAPGRYVDVSVEVFQDWGFLGLGTWESLSEELIRLQISAHTEQDAAAIAVATGDCTADEAACGLLKELTYRFDRLFSIVPDLGAAYRVRITNKTDARLGIVLAIDGLNTNGGATVLGADDDKKWILLPRQTVRIAGWQVTNDEALQFRFETPSRSHSSLDALRGEIAVYVYLPTPETGGSRGTAAGAVIDQPTVRIPFQAAASEASEIIRFRYARERVALGILCEEIAGSGVRINRVVEGTVAELRGLRAGDVITYANGEPIADCADLQAILAARSPGDRIVLKVHRAERSFLLTLELEE
jgi:hypothetical protein